MRKVVHPSGSDMHDAEPPYDVAMAFTRASPSPLPGRLRLFSARQNRLNTCGMSSAAIPGPVLATVSTTRLSKADFLDALAKWPWVSFCFVDDGSTDSTAEKIAHLERLSPSVRALYLPKNMGKAEAVRAGVRYLCNNACADYIGFWDADLATPLDEIPSFMRYFEERPHIKAVIGSR